MADGDVNYATSELGCREYPYPCHTAFLNTELCL